jgi:hypothetical protein
MFKKLFGRKAMTSCLSEPSFAAGNANGFWSWFADNAEKIAEENRRTKSAGRPPPESFIDAIHAALKRFDENLVFEMGIAQDGIHEFIVSADGIRASFPSVAKLVSLAPPLEGHRILAFRQREPGIEIMLNGTRIGGDNVRYEILGESEVVVDIKILLPHLELLPETDQRQITFLLLDTTLGEYDVATRIGYIEHRMLLPGEMSSAKPLSLLAVEIDDRFKPGVQH